MGKSTLVSGAQDHAGGLACLECLLPAVHTSTNGHRVSGLESRIAALVSKDRCRVIWKNRETRKSSRRRPCGYQRPRVQCCSSRRDKTPSWVWLSSLQAAHRVRCGVCAADQVHYYCRPSASPCPLASPLRLSLSMQSAAVRSFALSLTTAISPRTTRTDPSDRYFAWPPTL